MKKKSGAGGKAGSGSAKTKAKVVLAPYEMEGPLTPNDVKCSICISIFVEPVTFPCNHSVCYRCFAIMIRETTLHCPCCRYRLSVWTRNLKMDKEKLVNHKFMERLQKDFPEAIAARLLEIAQEDNNSSESGSSSSDSDSCIIPDDSGFFTEESRNALDGTISKPGEIAKDLGAIYSLPQKALDEENKAAEQASMAIIDQLMKEEAPIIAKKREEEAQLQADYELAKSLQEGSLIPSNNSNVLKEDNRLDAESLHSSQVKVISTSSLFQVTPANQKMQQKVTKSTKSSKKPSRKRPSSSQVGGRGKSTQGNKRNCTGLNSSFSTSTNKQESDKIQLKIENYFVRSPSAGSTISNLSFGEVRASSPIPSTSTSASVTGSGFNYYCSPNVSTIIDEDDGEKPGPSHRFYSPSLFSSPPLLFRATDDSLDLSKLTVSDSEGDDDDDNNSPSLLTNYCPSPAVSTVSRTSVISTLSSEGSTSSVPESQNYDPFFGTLEAQAEAEALDKFRLKKWQEEEDRKLAMMLAKEDESQNRRKTCANAYGIRNWIKSGELKSNKNKK